MIFNCSKCRALSLDYVNIASGLDLHRFHWLKNDDLIGELPKTWNHLVGVEKSLGKKRSINILHWTLGGPWFEEQRIIKDEYSDEWFLARENSIKLWD